MCVASIGKESMSISMGPAKLMRENHQKRLEPSVLRIVVLKSSSSCATTAMTSSTVNLASPACHKCPNFKIFRKNQSSCLLEVLHRFLLQCSSKPLVESPRRRVMRSTWCSSQEKLTSLQSKWIAMLLSQMCWSSKCYLDKCVHIPTQDPYMWLRHCGSILVNSQAHKVHLPGLEKESRFQVAPGRHEVCSLTRCTMEAPARCLSCSGSCPPVEISLQAKANSCRQKNYRSHCNMLLRQVSGSTRGNRQLVADKRLHCWQMDAGGAFLGTTLVTSGSTCRTSYPALGGGFLVAGAFPSMSKPAWETKNLQKKCRLGHVPECHCRCYLDMVKPVMHLLLRHVLWHEDVT